MKHIVDTPKRTTRFARVRFQSLVAAWLALAVFGSVAAGEAESSDIRTASAKAEETAASPASAMNNAPLIELDGSISISPDGGELTYEWKQLSGPKVELSDYQSAKPYFRTGLPGVYEFQLVVSANGLSSEPHVVRLEIERENLPPVAKIEPEAFGQVGTLLEIDGSKSFDPEGENLTFHWRPLTAGFEIPREALGKPVLAFPPAKDGVFEVELIVSDGEKKSAPVVCRLSIKPRPKPPVAQARINTIGVKETKDVSPAKIPEPVSDLAAMAPPNLESPTLPPALAPLEPLNPELSAVATLKPVSELEPFIPSAPKGTREPFPYLSLPPAAPLPPSVDSAAPAAPAPPAPQPVARIQAPQVVEAGTAVMLDGRSSFSPSGHRLEYLWRQKSGAFVDDYQIVFDGAAQRFTPPRDGDYEFELVVVDSGVESVPVLHQVRVVPQADPPVAVVVAPTHAAPGSLVKMDATQSYDLEGSQLIYRWRQTGGPAVRNYVIDERLGDSAPAFKPSEPGLYSFELVVSNGKLNSKPVEIDIEVSRSVRRGPGLSIAGPSMANAGDRLTYDAVLTDAAGLNLTFDWSQAEGPVRAMVPSGGIRTMVTPTVPGRYVFTLTARDGAKTVASTNHVLEVFNGRGTGDDGIPFVTPPVPVSGRASGGGPRRVPELTPLPNTPAPTAFPTPQPRGASSRTAKPSRQPAQILNSRSK